MVENLFLVICLFIALPNFMLSLDVVAETQNFVAEATQNTTVSAMYVFGDSLADAGNNNFLLLTTAKSNFPPYGVDFPTGQPTGRFCNGKIGVDLLAERLGVPFPTAYLSLALTNNKGKYKDGVNFASAAASILNANPINNFGIVIHLPEQVDNFMAMANDLEQQLGSIAAQIHLRKALFAFEIGNLDVYNYLNSNDLQRRYTSTQYLDMVTTAWKNQLKRLYARGARKFGFAGLSLLGCIPSQRVNMAGEGCNEEANRWAVMFNDALQAMLQQFQLEFPDTTNNYFDTYTILQNILQNPSAFGFTEVKAACCGLGRLNVQIQCSPITPFCSNRDSYVFWDLHHPSEATARIFVNAINLS